MSHPLAGKPVPAELYIDVDHLLAEYFDRKPNPENAEELVSFGTSGHRGSSLDGKFNEDHILAITQAICDYRTAQGIDGPLFVGMDTHALSAPASNTTLEVLAPNGVEGRFQENGGFTPTPVISNAILMHNRPWESKQGIPRGGWADGIVITPSHNPPRDGGFKYNPPSGGPAGSDATDWIQKRANHYLSAKLEGVKRLPLKGASRLDCIRFVDFAAAYISGLDAVIDFGPIRASGLKIGADPLGGAGAFYWNRIREAFQLPLTVLNETVDPTFSFMSVDGDGKVRMDCSSPFAMAGLIELKDEFDIAFGNDPDFDRHGIVTKTGGLMNPNHYLSASIEYLFTHRAQWPSKAAVGKTLVSSGMIDRVAASLGRNLYEVPVGFKWFVEGLVSGELGFGGEESAGASFLTLDARPWSTDKDGIIMNLLAAEMTAVTGKDPSERYHSLTERFGTAYYARKDAPANAAQKKVLSELSPDKVKADRLAREVITGKNTQASGNGASIGGLKVSTANGWFAARPSGTEDIYKIYAESFLSQSHLENVLSEAQNLVSEVFKLEGI